MHPDVPVQDQPDQFWLYCSFAVPISIRNAEFDPLEMTTLKVAVGICVVGGAAVVGAAVVGAAVV